MALTSTRTKKLDKILRKVGDLNFKRRVIKILDYLDIKKKDHVLDMGCGEGFYAMLLSQIYGCKITAVDYDMKIMGMAKGWLRKDNNIKFEKGDICKLKYKNNTFDKIICSEVLEHIVDHEKATSELYRVLKPGGLLAVTVPNKNYPFMWDPLNKIREGLGLGHFNPLNGFFGGIWAYDHKRLYLPKDLKRLLVDKKFEIKKLEVMTHYGVPFNHLVLYAGKTFYMNLPVPEEIKNSMEKFKWEDSNKEKEKTSFAATSMHIIINTVFSILKKVDSYNNKEFSLATSTMAVAALARKGNK